eukprot:Plantae.Rhodophyta-Hildenbrandia_rubra.ctg11119.p1 GENE.Plantae.Rhodophyta-Hildenbrandia_rubra.ctg11119~~Plantae.Rhodophyta-Hildenbrandia_rubra.ctg11119.p1  ORF type:complete len:479 (+),score=95.43 Plantae.Rhodophyta-Hildenbrandia_rubra.ctg11119:330-1766(+)
MNRVLLNPFETRVLPDTIDDYFPDYKITCFIFNKHGNILAAGTRTGNTIIFDFDTRTIATNLGSDLKSTTQVTSLSFVAPRTGPWTVIGYSNGVVRCYDTLMTKVFMEVKFVGGKGVSHVVCHPVFKDVVLVVVDGGLPMLVKMGNGCFEVDVGSVGDGGSNVRYVEACRDVGSDDEVFVVEELDRTIGVTVLGDEEELKGIDRRTKYVVEWNPIGDAVFRGGPGGRIKVYHFKRPEEKKLFSDNGVLNIERMTSVVVCGQAAIKHLVTSPKEDTILVNSNDRSLRVFKLTSLLKDYTVENGENYQESGVLANRTLEPTYTFNDPVNRVQWRCCCFSGDGEYILGGLAGTSHRIPIYRLSDGLLEKTLEGPKEGISDLSWHPLQGVILTLGTSYHGIYVWQRNYTENWSAFAPDFTELEENEEYEEPEDEFDLKDDKMKKREATEKEEETVVDIIGGDFEEMFSIPPAPKRDRRKHMR